MRDERESFLLDGGAPFYRTYETSDGKYMAVGAIEPQFFAQLLTGLGLSADEVPGPVRAWPLSARCTRSSPNGSPSKTRDEWTRIFAGTDACVTPVLTWTEAGVNEHLRARGTLIEANGLRAGRAGAAVLPHPGRLCQVVLRRA